MNESEEGEFGFSELVDDPLGIEDWDDPTDTWFEDIVEALSPQGLVSAAVGEETTEQLYEAADEAVSEVTEVATEVGFWGISGYVAAMTIGVVVVAGVGYLAWRQGQNGPTIGAMP